MDEQRPALCRQISQEDWERTPASVKQLVEEMQERLGQLEKQLASLQAQQQLLTEQTNRTSSNSSQSPSSDPPSTPKRQKKRKSGKKRGGQPGHEGHSRLLYPVEQCESVTDYYPQTCACCREKLNGEDANPYRHQIVDIPPNNLKVAEHRLHQLVCEQCGSATRAELPTEVYQSSYGPAVVAMVAVLSGLYRHSQRMVQSAMQDLFGITMSLGTVNSLRQEASDAVAKPVEEAHKYVQQQPVVGADETSWEQGNADASNPKGMKAWLWVAVTPLVTYFQIILSRSSEAAQNLLGASFGGILTSDRHGGYNWVDLERRQLCWAQMNARIYQNIGASRSIGTVGLQHSRTKRTPWSWKVVGSHRISVLLNDVRNVRVFRRGAALLKQQEKLFELWYRVRDGTLARCELIEFVKEIRQQLLALLQEGAEYEIGSQEKTPLAKTVRTCRQLLKVESAMWLFVTVEGVDATNNAAERAIRPAVLWRRTSFGTQSQSGSTFVARMLTVVTTLRSQNRNVLEYITQARHAVREGKPAPSLLPKIANSEDQVSPAA